MQIYCVRGTRFGAHDPFLYVINSLPPLALYGHFYHFFALAPAMSFLATTGQGSIVELRGSDKHTMQCHHSRDLLGVIGEYYGEALVLEMDLMV